MEELKGYIDHIRHQNPENGYTVMVLVTEGGEVTCVGTAKGYTAGETVEVKGEYVEHPVYGKQIRFSEIRSSAPTGRVALMRYLSSGAVHGIGEKRAVKIIEHFGDDTYRILEEEPERLAEIKGISPRLVREIAQQLAEKRDERRAVLFMQQYGISAALCEKLFSIYGDEIYGILKNNPYRLADEVPAVGFKKADEIARQAGIETDSDYRIRAGVQYVLNTMAAEGNCYYPRRELCEATAQLLLDARGGYAGALTERIDACLPALSGEKKLILEQSAEEERVYLNSFFYGEMAIAKRLSDLQSHFAAPESVGMTAIETSAAQRGLTLDESQKQAVQQCLKSGVFVLTGGPGTGKTTTINVILECLEQQGRSFALAAPTGRAAKRMSEATGYEAMTIHRLLEIAPAEDGQSGFSFSRSAEEPLEADSIVIDEASMVDVYLMRALVDAIPDGAQLILVGDVDQLPSVGPGQVLKDVIESKAFPTVHLSMVHRQGEESHIVAYAHRINQGERIDLSVKHNDFFLLEKEDAATVCGYVYQLISDVFPKYHKLDPLQIQVLTPMRKGPLGVEGLNRLLQERLNPPSQEKPEVEIGSEIFRVGDKVMQTKNDYQAEWEVLGKNNIVVESGTGVFNGDMGEIREINLYLRTATVVFDDARQVVYDFPDLDALELAYAVTIHKSQGSEYPVVILPILSGPPRLMTRNLLYTAVTRAKQCVVIVGSGRTVQQMIESDYVQKRYTSLKDRILSLQGD